MRKAILMMLLAVASSSALAEWLEIDSNKISTVYVDITTIRKAGNRVSIWSLHGYKTVRKVMGRTYRSIKMQSEYDCQEEKMRMLYLSEHSENNGGGIIIHSESTPDSNWRPVPTDSVSKTILEIACLKQ